ncbi:MAG: NTP transferase domain-containing protein [Acidobacteria bacterium]|nr:NTP transferase domain-containing protein [Acidobacteriota bacterium]NIM60221.1 NTP transferase domain-containing protein [Acidobacteriota bacterium]NIO60259.1 NTP transferase domain-containing protein [Acidobacteriota bacterium]NIQ31314.1 NTP transferase domain-containing protein [Acidobacteriota bacterium]NIQ86537.1 NTP transferase domain-containing protein [Acidobacteriota bacterium]
MIAAIVLAAGASRRYGSPKQLETLDGESWVHRAARLAREAGCSPVRVVAGSHVDRIRDVVRGLPDVQVVHHPGWQAGIGSSIAVGIQSFYRDPEIRAALLLTCDQTALSSTVLRAILDRFDGVDRRMIACAYARTVGIPALFERAWFGRLAAFDGDRGAKSLLLECPELRIDIEWPEGAHDRDDRRGPRG